MNTFGGKPLTDPAALRQQCLRFGFDLSWSGRANGFRCQVGVRPGSGWLLMSRANFEELEEDGLFDLTFRLGRSEIRTQGRLPHGFREELTVKSLLVVNTTSLTPGLRGDEDETLLLQVADRRWLYQNLAFDAGYNIRSVPDADYYTATISGGATPYTWAQVGEDIWDAFGSDRLGAWPGLPATPSGTPQNLRYHGVTAADALEDFLSRAGFALAWNPLEDTFSIVELGAADASADAWLDDWDDWRIHDGDPRPQPRATIPEKIRVLFRKLPPVPGGSPFYAVEVATPTTYLTQAARAEEGTVHTLHDDLPAIYDETPTLQNGSDLSTRAAARAAEHARWLAAGLESFQRTFALHCADPRAMPGKVVWDVEWLDAGAGMRTVLRRKPLDWMRRLTWPALRNEEVDTYDPPWEDIGIAVREVDLSPSYAAVNTIEFDQADGFVLSEPSPGVVRIDINAASASQVGIVTTSSQSFSGVKNFTEGMQVRSEYAGVPLLRIYGDAANTRHTFLSRGSSTDYFKIITAETGGIGKYAEIIQDVDNDFVSLTSRETSVLISVILSSADNKFTLNSNSAGVPCFEIVYASGTYTGDSGTDSLGNVFVGGICTTVGGGSAGSGTVTSFSFADANGFAGLVTNSTTTPQLTLSTTVTGMVKGNGTALSAAIAGTDYVAPGAITTSGLTVSATDKILGRVSASGGAVEEVAFTDQAQQLCDDTSFSAMRTTLGLAIGTDVQAWSANLDEYAAVNPTAAGLALLDDADAAAQRTTLGVGTGDSPQFTAINLGHASDTTLTRTGAGDVAVEGNAIYRAGGTDVPVADGGTGASTAANARTNLGLVIGTDVQAYDAELAALAGLTSAADRLPYFTGSGTASLATFTGAGRALLDDADAAAQRATLDLDDAGQAALSSDYSITAANGTFADTGLTVTLPSAGTYHVWADIRGNIQFSAGSIGFLSAHLYSVTDAGYISNAECLVVLGTAVNTNYQASGSINIQITTSGSKQLKLYAKRDSATTWTTSNVASDTNGRTRMGYERIY